jgi:hypothetical protein
MWNQEGRGREECIYLLIQRIAFSSFITLRFFLYIILTIFQFLHFKMLSTLALALALAASVVLA